MLPAPPARVPAAEVPAPIMHAAVPDTAAHVCAMSPLPPLPARSTGLRALAVAVDPAVPQIELCARWRDPAAFARPAAGGTNDPAHECDRGDPLGMSSATRPSRGMNDLMDPRLESTPIGTGARSDARMLALEIRLDTVSRPPERACELQGPLDALISAVCGVPAPDAASPTSMASINVPESDSDSAWLATAAATIAWLAGEVSAGAPVSSAEATGAVVVAALPLLPLPDASAAASHSAASPLAGGVAVVVVADTMSPCSVCHRPTTSLTRVLAAHTFT